MIRRSPLQLGFTLIEVLVALAIFAYAAAAISRQSGTYADQVVRLESRALAQWVAENQIAQLRATRDWPAPGRQRDEMELAGRSWQIEQVVAATGNADLRRVELAVSDADNPGQVIISLVTFLGRN